MRERPPGLLLHARTAVLLWLTRCIDADLAPSPSPSRLHFETGITVKLSEILQVGDDFADGEYEETQTASTLEREFNGVDPIDADCPAAGKCIGLLTRVNSRLVLSCACMSSGVPPRAWFAFPPSFAKKAVVGRNVYPWYMKCGTGSTRCLCPWPTAEARR